MSEFESALNNMMSGRPPDLVLSIWLVPHGYEARLADGKLLKWSKSRDRAESMPVQDQINLLSWKLYEAFDSIYFDKKDEST